MRKDKFPPTHEDVNAKKLASRITVKKLRIPKKGDVIAMNGRPGAFFVVEVSASTMSVDLQAMIGIQRSGPIERGIRWSTLLFLVDEADERSEGTDLAC